MNKHSGERLTIRRMTAEDIRQVVTVERACFSEPWSEEVFNATLLLPYAYYYVAELTEDNGNGDSDGKNHKKTGQDIIVP